MIAMRKRTVVCLTLAICLAGLGSAAAITYDRNRSVHHKRGTSQPEASAGAMQEQENVLCIPTITLIGRADE